MAIFDGKNLKGSIGNLVFSQHGKITIVKSKPGVGGVRQTEATKKSASIFGKYISPFAKQIRMAFSSLHQGFYDGAMINRMNSAISTIVYQHIQTDNNFSFNQNSFKRLEGFDFNLGSPLDKSLLLTPIVNYHEDGIEVSLPSFSISKNIRFPRNTTLCTLQVNVALFNMKQRSTFCYPIESILIERYANVFDGISLTYDFPEGNLAIIGVALLFSESKSRIQHSPNGKLFHPAGIVSTGFRV
ncbi:hypothetical protein DU508_11540 [Pedobacter chinensis]|uniref:Uncharacterized protein n=1 Tax=Pedobacter chinensis TaxID=2282421 RepID=A0A369PZ33_9SPHI|nr:hypothetical protein [Pedobacter chinensis]RDC56237.1 hypothetical protein DU508_11540 [Pedobacter chinensis]